MLCKLQFIIITNQIDIIINYYAADFVRGEN